MAGTDIVKTPSVPFAFRTQDDTAILSWGNTREPRSPDKIQDCGREWGDVEVRVRQTGANASRWSAVMWSDGHALAPTSRDGIELKRGGWQTVRVPGWRREENDLGSPDGLELRVEAVPV